MCWGNLWSGKIGHDFAKNNNFILIQPGERVYNYCENIADVFYYYQKILQIQKQRLTNTEAAKKHTVAIIETDFLFLHFSLEILLYSYSFLSIFDVVWAISGKIFSLNILLYYPIIFSLILSQSYFLYIVTALAKFTSP